MDGERKSHPVHENHGGHVCHKCGWTFPNPHPSAKLRRAHKKVCGKIEGFKLAKSDDTHQTDSDLSDDDHKPVPVPLPQPLSESSAKGSDGKKGSDSFRVEGEGAGVRSEEEVFSDAVAEFGDADSSRTALKAVDLDTRGVEMNAEQCKDLSQTVEKVVDLDACRMDMTLEESRDLVRTAGAVAGLDANRLYVNLEETQQSSQAAEKAASLDNHGIEMNVEEIQDSSKIAGEAVDLGVCGAADSYVKEMDPSHGLDAGLEMHGEENKESSRKVEASALDACGVNVNAEEIKGNDGVNHVLTNPPVVDNGAYDKHMSCCDQLRDLDGLQTKPDKDLQTSHSTTSESILDDRIHLAVEQTQDANLSSFSSHRASLVDKADDTMEDKDNSASEIMDYSTSVGPDEGAKHSEECTLSAEDAEEKEEIDEGDKVSVMKILHNDVASDSSGVGVQSDLKDTVTAATVNFSSKNLITDSREPDLKICQVHDEQTGGPEGLKPLEESHHSIPSGPIESDADSGDSVGVSKATDSSLPIAGVVPSNVQVQEDILLMDGSGSGSVLEGATIDQSSLREESTTEKHQDIELASTECAAKDVGPHELTFHKDSLNAESAVVNTISSKNLFGGSNEMEVTNASLTESEQLCSLGKDEIEATNLSLVENEKHCSLGKDGTGAMNVGLAENEQHFSLGKDDSSHQLSHEVSPETSAVPTAGDNVSDSLEGAEEATETPHGILSAEKDSGCDLPYELISETPRSSIADCSGEAQVLVNNSNGWPNSDRDSHLNLSHEVIKENSTVLVSGGNVAESVEGAEVLEKAVTSGGFDSDRNFGHDSSHKIMPEISIQPMDGSENAYSIDKAEVHETSTIHANGPDIACEETKANQTNVGGKYSQEGASNEASPSVIATIPESLTDDSKISSLHYEVLETDKLEKNKDFALGSKEMAVEGGPAPYNETADWGHAEHHGRELKMDWSIEAGENQLDMQNRAPEEIVSLSTGTGSCIQGSSVLENCTEEDFAARDVSKNHTHSVPGEGGDAVLIRNMNASILATDASVSSVSQDDSLEGHWGSISDIPTPKEVSDPSLKNGSTSGGIHADNSDVFEAPSFMTLVEPNKGNKRQATSEIQSAQKPASPSSQPGWFPSLMHVVNESQGRKKNEEIIEKVVNWSPGKPHTPLRNLLVEANIESKHKPSQKIQDRASPAPREEHALQEKGTPAKTGNTEVLKETTAKGDIEKEWSSPARLPVVKRERERRKVRGWVPFVCCSSIN